MSQEITPATQAETAAYKEVLEEITLCVAKKISTYTNIKSHFLDNMPLDREECLLYMVNYAQKLKKRRGIQK